MTEKPTSNVICVLGMHRSGTSCLTGSLQAAGVDLGKHHTWNRFNQKGNRENQDVVDFHDQLLADNLGSWDKPPRRLHLSPSHFEQARNIAAAFPPDQRWGFKDPRALLALELWKQVIPGLNFIGIFRHPLAVAASLDRRSAGGMSQPVALELWHQYNKRLLREYRNNPFPILCFDWDEQVFHRRLDAVLESLGLQQLDPENRFYTPDLRNYDSVETSSLPWKVRRLYRKLQAAAG